MMAGLTNHRIRRFPQARLVRGTSRAIVNADHFNVRHSKMRIFCVVPIFACCALSGRGAIPIPKELVGIWATVDSHLEGEALWKGEAIYLDTDGIGAEIGGDGSDVLGMRLEVTSWNSKTETLVIILTDNGKVVQSGTLVFDPKKRTIISPKDPAQVFHRRFETVSATIRSAIGIEAKK